ncbi:MAG: response regulator [Pirellulaceae bacterium]
MGDKVCVIDDDAASRETLQRLFRSVGVEHAAFDTAEVFLQRLLVTDVDASSADIRLRGMSGLELMEVLRKNKLMIPVVIVSGFATMRTAVRAMRMGALSVLSKPVDEEELWSTVREGLSQYAVASQSQNRHRRNCSNPLQV